ncbi:MAG: TerB family tellurite resistance protein [Lewinellaceae bacterium]|nr:TerB family tellurite resistance protein [Phaeodactylibacter sp.]MCB0615492.1 TerB family tellurite resistance protein [Phaeodactylibacter sp.]MCB9350546.1 TerB family tellurite resistance protein [Lewinellaceae bacterium]
MTPKERIYDAFGELLYLVAKADGLIQPEEVESLENILQNHPKARQIKWSFDYERTRHNDPEDLYLKVIDRCRENGPDPEYLFLIDILEEVARASAGIDRHEKGVIEGFVKDLTERFKKDIQSINELKN